MDRDVSGRRFRVRGIVQGVGFRPTVWRIANECALTGQVKNDARGVLIHAWGRPADLDRFADRLLTEAPSLARIDAIDTEEIDGSAAGDGFRIDTSGGGEVRTGVVADAAMCRACRDEINDPADRRYRYAFTNCTHCGPRLSIVRGIPYDRANTSMAAFTMCPACAAEYADPVDRRFHAQPNACAECGPRLWLQDGDGRRIPSPAGRDEIQRAAALIGEGAIVAIKGVGGVHLACDATDAEAVARLRERKQRYHKAFALMAADLDMVRCYARVEEAESALLTSSAAPIVVLEAHGDRRVAPQVAPGQHTLGFMLPYSPLHELLMQALDAPIVLTSGNRSEEPQCIDNDDALRRLAGIADCWLLHDRAIVNRLDDSVVHWVGAPRLLRRARGYAPASLSLPAGFERAPAVLAMGGELKNTFCLLRAGEAVVSQHMGDLEDAATHDDYRRNLALYRELYRHQPRVIAVDAHPDYLSTQWGRRQAAEDGLEVAAVQHHHAHIASCMGEHGLERDSGPVLGIALDGLGLGADGSLWGGEFLKVQYHQCRHLGGFDRVPMIGGAKAIYEPWRNTYAHLALAFGWERVAQEFAQLGIVRYLQGKPLSALDAMLGKGLNCPPSSSCGRLFDAVAAALDVCRDRAGYEGQAAMELEAAATRADLPGGETYAYDVVEHLGRPTLSWRPLWRGILESQRDGEAAGVIARRFHASVVAAVTETAALLCAREGLDCVVLSGGVFQNRLILNGIMQRLAAAGLRVLAPTRLPVNDGGISFGQALVAAARSLT